MALNSVGAVITLTPPEDGSCVWKATQVPLASGLPSENFYSNHLGINFNFGPITVSGYVDTDTLGIGVSLSILGISIGTFHGNLKDGLGVDVNLFAVQGSLKFYLKNGNEVWLGGNLSSFGSTIFDTETKVLTL
ncbi:hypothetical protein VTH82DRAFT_4927 [Thermothelomyces myriococcoides]